VNKYTEQNISIVVPSYNNLEYLKLLYQSVRSTSTDVELIMYADGCTDGTWEWLQTLVPQDVNLHIFNESKRIGHTILYDRGFQYTNRPIIGILHADMVVHSRFFTNVLKHIRTGTVVCATCVEPPLHPPGGEKHIFNAGMYPHDFNMESFSTFCDARDVDQVRRAIFAPWFILREEYMNRIGGHDIRFAPYGYEDADLFTRMHLQGFDFVQSRDAFVYHFTQRGHKWTKGVGIENDDYKDQMNHTRKEYVRKFGTDPLFDENHAPIPAPKYDIGYVISHGYPTIFYALEPYCTTLYIDMIIDAAQYALQERSTVSLMDKIQPFTTEPFNDIVVTFDGRELTQFGCDILTKLPLIIQETNDVGQFTYDIFTITIHRLREIPL
jgi:GT2 family glycosyltransferase